MKFVLAACLLAGAAHAAPVGVVVEIDRSVARVGDVVIWESDIAARLKAGGDRVTILEGLIDDELVLAEATKAGIVTDRADVLAALDEIKTQNNLDDAGLEVALKDAGYTRARYMVELERQLQLLRAVNQLVAPKITIEPAAVDAEVKARGLAPTAANKDTVRVELRRKAITAAQGAWVKELRKRAFITRRP